MGHEGPWFHPIDFLPKKTHEVTKIFVRRRSPPSRSQRASPKVRVFFILAWKVGWNSFRFVTHRCCNGSPQWIPNNLVIIPNNQGNHPQIGLGWFEIFLIFTPINLGKMNPIWRAYFSNGLVQPPASSGFFTHWKKQVKISCPPKKWMWWECHAGSAIGWACLCWLKKHKLGG